MLGVTWVLSGWNWVNWLSRGSGLFHPRAALGLAAAPSPTEPGDMGEQGNVEQTREHGRAEGHWSPAVWAVVRGPLPLGSQKRQNDKQKKILVKLLHPSLLSRLHFIPNSLPPPHHWHRENGRGVMVISYCCFPNRERSPCPAPGWGPLHRVSPPQTSLGQLLPSLPLPHLYPWTGVEVLIDFFFFCTIIGFHFSKWTYLN